jgi:hypothetical protein
MRLIFISYREASDGYPGTIVLKCMLNYIAHANEVQFQLLPAIS